MKQCNVSYARVAETECKNEFYKKKCNFSHT